MSRGEVPRTPGGNENEPTWWKNYSQDIWDMPFTFIDIEGERGRESKDFQAGVAQSGVPDKEVYANMDTQELAR